MDSFYNLIGPDGSNLSYFEMGLRATIIFILAIIILRLAGRRSFGMGSPLDIVVSILMGAILSRAVTGVSPFFPTITSSLVLALLHRGFAMIGLYSRSFGSLVKGEARIIYENGKINRSNMNWSLISDKDLMEGIRKEANVESLDDIDKVFVERDGKISVVKYTKTIGVPSKTAKTPTTKKTRAKKPTGN